MKCANCKEEMYMQVKVIIEMPVRDAHKVSKKSIATKYYKIIGACWDDVSLAYCNNCNYAELL